MAEHAANAPAYDDEAGERARHAPRHSRVRSAPMTDGKVVEQAKRARSPIVALFAIAVALPAWLEGARTTRDGWVLFANWVLGRAHIPVEIAPATTWAWWVALGVLVALGYGYSRVEIQHAPIRPPKNWRKEFFVWSKWHFEPAWQRWLVWFVLIITDVGTMYLGARSVQAGDAAIFQQIAASAQAAAVYAIILTFIPDQLLRYGWRSLRGG